LLHDNTIFVDKRIHGNGIANNQKKMINLWIYFTMQQLFNNSELIWDDKYFDINVQEDDIRNKYVPISTEDKVNIHSIYTTIQTRMSVYYSDKMIVEFAPRKKTFIEKAAQINRLAQFDYDEM
jgi:hypothetical protein